MEQLKLHALAHGWGTAFKAAVVFAAIALIAALVGVRSQPGDGAEAVVVPAAG